MKSSTVPLHYPKAKCEVKQRTDAWGGVKIIVKGGSVYGYPHYRSLRAIPQELQGIDPDVWASFFVQVDSIQESSNGSECIGILVLFLGTGVFFTLLKLFGNAGIAIVGAVATMVGMVFVVPRTPKGQRQSLDDLCLLYEQKFRDQGWKVSCHCESTPPPPRPTGGIHGQGSHSIWVVHFIPTGENGSVLLTA
ncbi:unnamed protein product [Cylindrotheca closterium]|uniref:Uncharacterized protein n=1 Tax=Cylindrotheca closterium TaxID=2856 RepID=A0AAD2CPK2_9STRA|nr:unnamed protein product [Cylindrotheca closterium]